MQSPYDVLGLDPDADDGEIERAYRERVKEVHPDQGGSAHEFRAVQRAYERIQAGYEPDRESGAGDGGSTGGTANRGRERGRARGYRPGRRGDDGEESWRRRPEEHTVEYLNYEVLDDYGWDLEDEDLFEKAAAADLDEEDHGQFVVEDDEHLLEAAEDDGHAWPFACRGGACSNCVIKLKDGELPPPASHVLTDEMIDQGIRLSCITSPESDLKVVYNAKHLPDVSELLLPASRFKRTHSD